MRPFHPFVRGATARRLLAAGGLLSLLVAPARAQVPNGCAEGRPDLLFAPPLHLAVDGDDGRIAVSESVSRRVLLLDTAGTVLDVIGGRAGHADGPFDGAGLCAPGALCFADGRLVFVDDAGRLLRLADPETRSVRTLRRLDDLLAPEPRDTTAVEWRLLNDNGDLRLVLERTGQCWDVDADDGTLTPADASDASTPDAPALEDGRLLEADSSTGTLRLRDPESGTIHLLRLRDLRSLAPSLLDLDTGPVEELPGDTVAPGSGYVTVNIALPPGWTAASDVAPHLSLVSRRENVLYFLDPPGAPGITLPFDAAFYAFGGRALLSIDIVLFARRAGDPRMHALLGRARMIVDVSSDANGGAPVARPALRPFQ